MIISPWKVITGLIVVLFVGCTGSDFVGGSSSNDKDDNSAGDGGSDAGDADGGTDGQDADGGADGGPDGGGEDGEADGGADGEADAGGDGNGGKLSDEERDALPGVEVERVGVNFEDLVGGDNDYNDAVFCFTGAFKVDGHSVVSLETQTVRVDLTNRSGMNHTFEILVIDEDGNEGDPITGDTRNPPDIDLEFGPGSKLFVKIDTEEGNTFDIEDPVQVEVAPDVCNVDGD